MSRDGVKEEDVAKRIVSHQMLPQMSKTLSPDSPIGTYVRMGAYLSESSLEMGAYSRGLIKGERLIEPL